MIELKQRGLPNEEIAKRVGKSRRTICRWLKQGAYRDRVRSHRHRLDAYFPYIAQRWDKECENAMELWRELVDRGYRGSYHSLYRYLHRQNFLGHRTGAPSEIRRRRHGPLRQVRLDTLIPTPSPRATTWMLLRPEGLEEKQREMIDRLCRLSPETKTARELSLSFIEMVRQRQAGRLESWVGEAVESQIPELKSFAENLLQDKKAVEAALTYEWSNGTRV